MSLKVGTSLPHRLPEFSALMSNLLNSVKRRSMFACESKIIIRRTRDEAHTKVWRSFRHVPTFFVLAFHKGDANHDHPPLPTLPNTRWLSIFCRESWTSGLWSSAILWAMTMLHFAAVPSSMSIDKLSKHFSPSTSSWYTFATSLLSKRSKYTRLLCPLLSKICQSAI